MLHILSINFFRCKNWRLLNGIRWRNLHKTCFYNLGIIHIWRPWKSPPSRPPPTFLVQLRPKFFHPLDLGRPISKEPNPISNVDLIHLPETNLVPRAILILKTSFSPSSYSEKMCWGQGWAEASLSPFLWLYILVCAVVQKYH